MTHLGRTDLDALPVVRPIPFVDPVRAFGPFAGDPVAALLDAPTGQGIAYLCADPWDVVRDADDPFTALENAISPFRQSAKTGLPAFQGGAVGLLGYELGGRLERLPAPKPDDVGAPDVVFGLYDTVAAFDVAARRAWVISQGFPETDPARRRARAEARAEEMARAIAAAPPLADRPPPPLAALPADQDRAAYEARIGRVIDYVRAGDVFQANLSQRFSAARPGGLDVFGLYRRLRAEAPAPFAAMLNLDGAHLLSASPERFLGVGPDGRVETRPIKGTRPRGATPDQDRGLAEALLASEKDRAENLMIVDLLRNDLSRVAALGSVAVPTLCGLESFATVHHLVSVVTALLKPGLGPIDLLRASFPGGSITGAPKIRAMEIIDELEPVRRGPYCGSVVRLGFDRSMDSSIVIRSLTVGTERIAAQAGGGIVADSDPAAEYDETLAKAAALIRAATGEAP